MSAMGPISSSCSLTRTIVFIGTHSVHEWPLRLPRPVRPGLPASRKRNRLRLISCPLARVRAY
jgi:hypothetical protein